MLITYLRWLACALLVPLAVLCGGTARADSSTSQTFTKLLDEAWDFDMRESPLWATQVGDHRFDDQLDQVALEDQRRRLQAKRGFLQRLGAIERTELAEKDQTNYDIFKQLLEDEVAEFEFRSYLIPITNRSGFHVSFPELPHRVPLGTRKDFENYIQRLRAFDRFASQHIQLLRAGIEAGWTLPSVVLEGFQEPIVAHIVEDPAKSLLYAPLAKMPEAIAQEDRQPLIEAGRRAIAESVVPGYRKFLAFMETEYVPRARGSIGASALPRGREFYRHRVRQFTTLDVMPDEVHQLGLSEVKRIRQEMDQIIAKLNFDGDFAAFIQFLRTDPQFYAKSGHELLKEVTYVLKRMDGELPRLFGTLPRTPYGIREIPSYIAPRTTTAYYMPPTGDRTQAGFYYVNTFQLTSRPLYDVEALSLHEAVPGHHLQIALQQELADLPPFRRFGSITAFVEGWGLYAERLGLEVGFYEDPYSDFGRLTYEMWRACRLVVDTGVHYFGWTREQAIDFMASNSALALHNIRAEVDRYISWPGQAVAYKMGELKIRQLRALAEQELGDRFDVRQFHDAVLRGGAVPLTILESQVKGYIEQARAKGS